MTKGMRAHWKTRAVVGEATYRLFPYSRPMMREVLECGHDVYPRRLYRTVDFLHAAFHNLNESTPKRRCYKCIEEGPLTNCDET